ncbi:hypothetical protein BgiBS90_019726 [Biomphalaria glabrata]|nr:hypothetical protein BgiBS90_019726 [Biomphalaria glabrata]
MLGTVLCRTHELTLEQVLIGHPPLAVDTNSLDLSALAPLDSSLESHSGRQHWSLFTAIPMAWFFPLCLILMFVPLIVSESLSCTWIEHNAIEEDDAKEVKLKRIPENKPTYDPKRKTRLYNVSASVAGTLELDCGLCSISNVDVMAHSEYSKNSCQGLTQELKTSSMDCWWKNNCTVTYIPSIIVFPEKEMPPYCFGKETNVIELKYSCVENYGNITSNQF